MDYLDCGADISGCGTYRYVLWRRWSELGPRVVWVMLNPSTADGQQDDPTIRRVVGFTQAMGGAEAIIVNLYALRATDPKELFGFKMPMDVIGRENDAAIRSAITGAHDVVCAWGAGREPVPGRAASVRGRIRSAKALRLTKNGHPSHPLYLPKSLTPQPWVTP